MSRRLQLGVGGGAGGDPREVMADGAELGATFARVGLLWNRSQNWEHLPYDWAEHDELLAACARAGLRPIGLLAGTACYATGRPRGECWSKGWPPLARFAPDWKRYVGACVERYGPDGRFWAEHPELEPRPVRTWEVWNEPNLAHFWAPEPDPRAYAELLEQTAAAIRGVDPRATVLVGGLTAPHRRARQWIVDLFATPGVRRHFDGVAIHPYARTPREVAELCRWFAHIARAPLYITEVGWATAGGTASGAAAGGGHWLIVSERTQARYVAQTIRRLRRIKAVRCAIWFSARDLAPAPGREHSWDVWAGLRTRDGRRKPAWWKFKRQTRRQ